MMNLIRGNALFGNFGQGIRTMYLSVRRPRLVRGWAVDRFEEESTPSDKASESVRGIARLEEDTLTVIGSDQEPTRTFRFQLTSYESSEELKAEWTRLKAFHVDADPLRDLQEASNTDDEKKRLQYLRNVYAQFEKQPPTAHLGFWKGDWEIGIKDHWYLECKIPRATFEQLAADLQRNHCHHLKLGLELAPTLIDSEYAPPSVSVTWGVFNMGKSDSGRGQGWLSMLSWRVVSMNRDRRRPLRIKTDSNEGQPPSGVTAPYLPTLEESVTTLNSQMASLAQSTRRGFLFVFVLLVLVLLLRIL